MSRKKIKTEYQKYVSTMKKLKNRLEKSSVMSSVVNKSGKEEENA